MDSGCCNTHGPLVSDTTVKFRLKHIAALFTVACVGAAVLHYAVHEPSEYIGASENIALSSHEKRILRSLARSNDSRLADELLERLVFDSIQDVPVWRLEAQFEVGTSANKRLLFYSGQFEMGHIVILVDGAGRLYSWSLSPSHVSEFTWDPAQNTLEVRPTGYGCPLLYSITSDGSELTKASVGSPTELPANLLKAIQTRKL